MNKTVLEKFIIRARQETYATGGGKTEPLLKVSSQLEFKEGDWFYQDVYYTGKNTFVGLESVYYQNNPVFSMSYYGNWGNMTEEEIDEILRGALVANPKTRLYHSINWAKDGFAYECAPDENSKSIDEIGGYESISKNGEEVHRFYYAGSVLD